MKKSLIYFVAFATVFGLLPVVNSNFVSAQSCDPDALRPVSYGQRGPAVRNLQVCLMEAGYDIPAGATGYFGSQTASALRSFYGDEGIKEGVRLGGRVFGPKGIEALRNILAGTAEESTMEEGTAEEGTAEEGTTGGSTMEGGTGGATQQQNQLLTQLLPLILALTGVQLDPTSSAQLTEALANNDFATAMTIILTARQQSQQQQQQQQQTGEEGFLSAEKDPTVGVVTLREGETGRVAGIRFKADNGAVTVKSIFLRWTGSVAPYRVISFLALKDSAGNTLYQTQVNNNTFSQDSDFNYYLPISGLNFNVPKNSNASVFIEVTVVNTLPSGASLGFELDSNDVRGRDGAGIDRFAPASNNTPISSVTLESSLSGSAYFIGALNTNSPREGYVVASDVNNKNRNGAPVLTFDLKAKNDNLRLTQISGTVNGSTSSVSAVSLRQGSTILDTRAPSNDGSFTFNVGSSNLVINRDQTASFDVLANLTNAASSSVATFTVTLNTATGVNSLGEPKGNNINLTSNVMHWVLIGPKFSLAEKSISVRRESENSTTTIVNSAIFKVKIKALNGSVYIPSTSAATITLELSTGTPLTVDVGVNVSEVRDSASNTVNVNPSDNGYYKIPEDSEYTFEFKTTDQRYSNLPSVRAILSSIKWDVDTNTSSVFSANFLKNYDEYRTVWASP